MKLIDIIKLANYTADDYVSSEITGETLEISLLQDADVKQLMDYYYECEDILNEIVKGKFKITECNGIADYPYCVVEVDGDVINFNEGHRLQGFYFEKVTGDFYCTDGGLTSLHTNTNCGSGYGFCVLIDTLHGNLYADNNDFRNLNGLSEVYGNVYIRGCKKLVAIKESYDGFCALDSKVPMERIFTDKEVNERGYIHTNFRFEDYGEINGIKYSAIIQEMV